MGVSSYLAEVFEVFEFQTSVKKSLNTVTMVQTENGMVRFLI